MKFFVVYFAVLTFAVGSNALQETTPATRLQATTPEAVPLSRSAGLIHYDSAGSCKHAEDSDEIVCNGMKCETDNFKDWKCAHMECKSIDAKRSDDHSEFSCTMKGIDGSKRTVSGPLSKSAGLVHYDSTGSCKHAEDSDEIVCNGMKCDTDNFKDWKCARTECKSVDGRRNDDHSEFTCKMEPLDGSKSENKSA